MRLLILIASFWALVASKPEMYKEKEDFQFSRSSSDDGSKSGFYGAQRGNMGGNYEKAHNMDTLAQRQMSTLVNQVDGELGEGANTRTGSVFSAANSRGFYGSGNYDLTNLRGRNFAEGTSFADSLSHMSDKSDYSGYGSSFSAANNERYSNSRSQSSRFHSGYQTSGATSQHLQTDEQKAADNTYGANNYEYDSQSGNNYMYNGQTGSQARTDYRHSTDQTNLNSANGYEYNTRSRLIHATPVRVYIRPGTRVAIPVAAQTYDASQSSSALNHDTITSDAEILSNNGHRVSSRPTNNAKHYESSFSYRKEWEKHDTIPTTVTSTENPFPINSELYEDAKLSQTAANQYAMNELGTNSRSSNANNIYSSGSTASSSSQSRNTAQSYSSGTRASNAYDFNRYNNAAANLLESHNLDDTVNSNSQVEDVGSKPKSYHSSYSYHKSWERRGDPYVIKPVGGDLSKQASQRLTAASANQGYSSQTYCGYCIDDSQQRVKRSLSTDEYQQYQNIQDGQEGNFRLLGQQGHDTDNKWDNLENLGQQSQKQLEDLGQQSYDPWKNIEELGQQTQDQWDKSQDLGQQSQNQWGNQDLVQQSDKQLEDLEQQSYNPWQNLEDLGQQTQDQWGKLKDLEQEPQNQLEDLGQQSQSQRDKLEDLGQRSQNQWGNQDLVQESQKQLEDLGQQSYDPWKNLEELSQQTQDQWGKLKDLEQEPQNQLEDLGQQIQDQWGKLEDLGQQSQNQWGNQDVVQKNQKQFEDLGQQSYDPWKNIEQLGQQTQDQWDKLKDLGQQPQNQLEDLGQHPQNQLEDLGQQTQDQWSKLEDLGQQTQNQWNKLDSFGQQSQKQWDYQEDLGQQTMNHWDKLKDLGQVTEDLGQYTQKHWKRPEYVGQQMQNHWDKTAALNEQKSGKDNLDRNTQSQWDKLGDLSQPEQIYNQLEDLGQQTQNQWDKHEEMGQETQSQRNKLELDQQAQNQLKIEKNFDQQSHIERGGNTQTQSHWEQLEHFGQHSQWNHQERTHVQQSNSHNIANFGQDSLNTYGYHENMWNEIDKIFKEAEAKKIFNEQSNVHDSKFKFVKPNENKEEPSENKEQPKTIPNDLNNPINKNPQASSTTNKSNEGQGENVSHVTQPTVDIGRGDIGPEDTVIESSNSNEKINYKTPKEIESLSLNKETNQQGESSNWKEPLILSVTGLNEQRNSRGNPLWNELSTVIEPNSNSVLDHKNNTRNSDQNSISNIKDSVSDKILINSINNIEHDDKPNKSKQMPASIGQGNKAQIEAFEQHKIDQLDNIEQQTWEQQSQDVEQQYIDQSEFSNIDLNPFKEQRQLNSYNRQIVTQQLEPFENGNFEQLQSTNLQHIEPLQNFDQHQYTKENNNLKDQSIETKPEINSYDNVGQIVQTPKDEKMHYNVQSNMQVGTNEHANIEQNEAHKSQNVEQLFSKHDDIPIPIEPTTEKPGFWGSAWNKAKSAKSSIVKWFHS